MYFGERDCVPAIRTRDRPIIDVPYRCVVPGITSAKTVPSRISTASSPLHTPPLLVLSLPSLSHPHDRVSLPIANHPVWSASNFSRLFIARETVSRQNIHKTGPFRTIRSPRFQVALWRCLSSHSPRFLAPLPPLPPSLLPSPSPGKPSVQIGPSARY